MATTRVLATPIVLELATTKGKKKKKRSAMNDASNFERQLYKAAKRTAGAADRGLTRYNKARRKSAKRERNGEIIDLIPNMARGAAVATGRMAPVPLDLLRAGFTPSMRRATRRSVRMTARMLDGS